MHQEIGSEYARALPEFCCNGQGVITICRSVYWGQRSILLWWIGAPNTLLVGEG